MKICIASHFPSADVDSIKGGASKRKVNPDYFCFGYIYVERV